MHYKLIYYLAAMFCVVAMSGCDIEPLPEDGSGDIHAAWVYTQMLIERDQIPDVVDPDFEFGGFENVQDVGGGVYRVRSYVDCPNVFGGKVRRRFVAETEKLEGGNSWRMNEFMWLD